MKASEIAELIAKRLLYVFREARRRGQTVFYRLDDIPSPDLTEGTLYFDVSKNRWWQFCPAHGWIDVTDQYGNYDPKLFEEHEKCIAVQGSEETEGIPT